MTVILNIPRRLRSLSLRRQQLIFFSVITVFVLLLIVTTVGITARYSRVFGTSLNRYFHIQELRSGLSDIQGNLEIYFRTADRQQFDHIEAQAERVRESYGSLVTMNMEDIPSRLELRATYYGLTEYERTIRDAVTRLQRGDEVAYITLTRAERIRQYVDSYLERLFQIQLAYGRQGYDAALQQQNTIRVLGLGGILLVGMALTVFALLFSRSVTRPLDLLVHEAHALAAGDFDRPSLEIPDSGDLRDVALAFNRMTSSIRKLLEDLTDQHDLERKLHQQELSNISMERLLREAQLVALQSQINPHFLFNTLNSVARMARIEEAESSEKLIRGLSAVLRYILRNPRRSVAVREEIRIVEEYLALQAVRFGTRLTYRVVVESGVSEAQMPPLILQPLVENAVLYGIEPLEGGGEVSVSVSGGPSGDRDDDVLKIVIEDNGAGMSSDTVRHLLQDAVETSGDSTTGIGVLNVRARLDLFFAGTQRFHLVSTEGVGTRVEIQIPLHMEAETYGFHRVDR
jgi:two-component system, sensor histidine kinase YesM